MNLSFAVILLNIIVCCLLILGINYYRKIANTDEITSLNNYRWFYKYLSRKFSLYKNQNKKLSIAIIDIDNFRVFNKINVHTGDEVLNEFAYEMNNFFMKEAIITRYRMGDEFALIFLNKNKDGVTNRFFSLCKHFNEYSFNGLPDDFKDYKISFSYGIAELNSDIHHLDDLLFKAEADLAEAKKMKIRQ